jgi:hypothetical protein
VKQDTEHKITVEDLLRLKRAERPAAEFWATFETEIRAKQLAAIVSKRPWWDGISRAFVFLSRHQLPVGAAAALALTWAGVRYVGGNSEVISAPRATEGGHVSVAAIPAPAARSIESAVSSATEVAVMASQVSVPAEPSTVAASASHLNPAPAAIVADSAASSPFSDGIAVTLSDYREALPAPAFTQRTTFGADSEFEASAVPARQVQVDPLAKMDPSAERRARLLAPALPAGYASASQRALASDWMKARASSNERMYESMDRGSSDQMLVGFRF